MHARSTKLGWLADGVTTALGKNHGRGRDIPVACGRLTNAADTRAQHGHPKQIR